MATQPQEPPVDPDKDDGSDLDFVGGAPEGTLEEPAGPGVGDPIWPLDPVSPQYSSASAGAGPCFPQGIPDQPGDPEAPHLNPDAVIAPVDDNPVIIEQADERAAANEADKE